MNFIKETLIKLLVKQIENWIGKYAQKFQVLVDDKGDEGFTITINVYEKLGSVMTRLSKGLAGLVRGK